MTDLTGKTVLITGASRGIGASAARHFAGKGALVALLARNGEVLRVLAKEIGPNALVFPGDVSDWPFMAQTVRRICEHSGKLDVLVNNAGTIHPITHLMTSDPTDWSRVIDINLKGVYHGIRAALPAMVQRGEGTILNISSGAATGALEGWSHYCATKAAVLSLTRCADKENRQHGVRVIGLSPGTVATDMQREIRTSGLNPVSRLEPDVHIPPEWVAQALARLCGSVGDAYLGRDFSLKTDAGRAAIGLPPISS